MWETDNKTNIPAGELFSTKHLGIWEGGGRGEHLYFLKCFQQLVQRAIEQRSTNDTSKLETIRNIISRNYSTLPKL